MLLHAVVSPLVMGLIFVLVVVPTASLMRLFGKDALDITLRGWAQRTIDADSTRNQF
jgi:hypothetical protein